MLSKAWLGALTPSLASLASSAKFTIVETADSLVVLLTASSEAISEDNQPKKEKKTQTLGVVKMPPLTGSSVRLPSTTSRLARESSHIRSYG
jgi:hypothetical protein